MKINRISSPPNGSYFKEILFLVGKDKRKVPLLVCCFLLVGILDVLGISLIVPYVALIVDPELLKSSRVSFLVDILGVGMDSRELIFLLSTALALIFSLKAFSAIGIHWLIVKFANNKLADMRAYLMNAYQAMPYDRYIQRNSSEYIFAMQSLTTIFAGRVLIPGLRALSDAIVCVSILFLLAIVSGITLAYLSAVLLIAVLLYDRMFKGRLRRYGVLKNITGTKILKRLNEAIDGLKEIRIIGAEHYFYADLVENAKVFSKVEARTQAISAAPRYLLEVVIVLFLVAIVTVSIAQDGNLTELIPILTMFSFAALRLLPIVNSILGNVIALRANRPAVGLLYKDIKDLGIVESVEKHLPSVGSGYERFSQIELRKIYYSYPTAKQAALEDISFSIKAGQSVGIIGASGSGKTTILDLLLGLLDPTEGEVYFNGQELSKVKALWAKNVAYLPQEIFLADSSLRENVALGIRADEINEKTLLEAINQARLSALIDDLPEGLNTVIGERGIRLSGGQRQRIALARAFYHKRSVLVFDEATSALDDDTEKEIIKEICQLGTDKTIIMIAHRLTTLKDCDTIIKLENGRITDVGSFQKIIGAAQQHD